MPQVSNSPKRSSALVGWRTTVLGFAVVLLLFAVVLLLSGCSTPQPTATWWNPGTWFSGRAGDRVEARQEDVHDTQADLSKVRETLILVAQEEAILTDIALEHAPDSRPVEIARGSAENTVEALDEAVGATDKSRIVELESLIGDLLSENEEIRAEGEMVLREKEATFSVKKREHEKAQVALVEAQAELAESVGLLEVAFDRENALADKYRNVRFAFIALLILAGLVVAVMVYLRFIGMGALGSIVSSIERFKGQAGMDDVLTDISRSMNNRQKKFIRAQRARSLKKDL